jgi:hypothetical protein
MEEIGDVKLTNPLDFTAACADIAALKRFMDSIQGAGAKKRKWPRKMTRVFSKSFPTAKQASARSLVTLISSVVSTGGGAAAADPQKLSVNSLQTIMVLSSEAFAANPARGKFHVGPQASAYHIDARADGFESGGH